MAKATVGLVLDIDGVPTDADSTPVLSDATGTWGVRRADTHEIIVAADTEMVRVGVGVYTFEFDGAEGIAHEYATLAIVGGMPLRKLDTITPKSAIDIDAYLTPDEAREIATEIGLTPFTGVSDADLAVKLRRASIEIDAAGPWQGQRLDKLWEFPRIDGERVIDADQSGEAVVPTLVEIAVVQQARWLLDPSSTARREAAEAGLKSQSIGSASESYETSANWPSAAHLCPQARSLLGRFRLRSGRLA